MTFSEESLPNLLRATATLIRITHGPGCPDLAAHRRAADLLERAADAEETCTGLRAGERDAALQTAAAYLHTPEPAEVPA